MIKPASLDLLGWLPLILFLAILSAAIAHESWKYRECRKVGHSMLYCLP